MDKLFKRVAASRSLPGTRSHSVERGEQEVGGDSLLKFQNEWLKELLNAARARDTPERVTPVTGVDRETPDPLDRFVGGVEEKDRLRTLLELLSMMSPDRQSIEHSDLEQQLKKVVNNYVDLTPLKAHIDAQISGAHGSRAYNVTRSLVTPPTGFSSEVKEPNLRRLKDIMFIFSCVKTFDNLSSAHDIRSFLMAMGSAVAGIECSITATEFRYAVVNKMSSQIRQMVSTHLGGDHSLEALYHHLMVLYDVAHTPDSAWLALTATHTTKFTSLRSLLEHALSLMDMAGVESSTRAPLFISILRNHIDEATYARILDWKLDYQKNYLQPLTLTTLMDYLGRFRSNIDRHLERNHRNQDKGGKVYNVKQGERMEQRREPVNHGPRHGNRSSAPVCKHCQRTGHNSEQCWFQSKCQTCGRKHETFNCPGCKLCGSAQHSSVRCDRYKCEPVSGVCKFCLDRMNVRLFHPMVQCRNRPESVPKN